MEAAPKTPDENSEADLNDHQDFLESTDDENMGQYKDGRHVIMGDDRFEAFRTFLEDGEDYFVSEDRLDVPMDVEKSNIFGNDDDDVLKICSTYIHC